MIRIEISNDEVEYSTCLNVEDVYDIMHCMEEMVRMLTDNDMELDNYILKRADEIDLKNCN